MTDELQAENQGEILEEPVGSPVDSDEDQKPIFNKIQMSDVVKREQQKAYEKGKREALMELQQQQEQQQEQQQSAANQNQAPSSLGGMAQMSPDDIRRMIAEQAPQVFQDHVQQLQTKQTVDSFVQKMVAAEQRHPGLEAKLNDLDYSSLAPLVQMANEMENTGDIMAELLDNPHKMGNLMTLMYTQPKLALRQMHELSNSIKQNQDALAQDKSAKEPLSQIKTSSNAGMDNGSMSVSDYRKMFRN
ncbi:MAG: hypothetical protein ACRC1W_12235 [Shewanella sp.]